MFGVELGYWTTACLVGIVTFLVFYCWYFKGNGNFWADRGIQSAKPKSFFTGIYEIYRRPFHEIECERYSKYGAIYGHFEGNQPFLSVADPALLRDIFVKDFPVFATKRVFNSGDKIEDSIILVMKGGEDWKRIRSIITPTFSTGKIKKMLSILKDCSKTVVENCRTASMEGKTIDAKRMYGAFTMDVIASTAFSTKIDSHNDPDNPFVTTAKDVFNVKVNWRIIFFMMFPRLMRYFKIPVLFPHAIPFFKNVTYQIMEERKRTGQTRNDFLQLLMDTAKEVADEESLEKGDIVSNYGVQEDINAHIFKSVVSKNLSMEELVAQCVSFFIAGYDTTATTLSLVSYELALNPGIQDKVREEVEEALQQYDGELTYEAIQKMKYLDNVISETLRKYPPIVRTERMADIDYKLGNTGITVPKGIIITVPIWAMQRDPKFFPNPEKFDPDRFTTEEISKRVPYSYLPFGMGPRSCVAMRFALVEIKVCLAHVLSNFNVKRCPETKVPLEFDSGRGTLHPIGIVLEMELRKSSPLVK